MSASALTEEFWTSPQSGHRLFYRLWRPPDTTRAIVIVHGFGEHGGRYHPVAEDLASRGMAVAVPDLWGHGRSGGARGDIEHFSHYGEDLQALAEQVVLPATGERPFAVFGHSFGALVALHWTVNQPSLIRRLVVQSPLLAVGFPVPAWKQAAARWLGRFWPSASLPMDLDVNALSHDPAIIQAYREDPLVHNVMSARTYHEFLNAAQQVLTHAVHVQVPTLLLYGEQDRVVSVETAKRWFAALTCPKRIVGFAGAAHELHHEAVRDEALRLVGEWVMSE
jgi:alpha-beta hydrolase superfamily lysophospholipase